MRSARGDLPLSHFLSTALIVLLVVRWITKTLGGDWSWVSSVKVLVRKEKYCRSFDDKSIYQSAGRYHKYASKFSFIPWHLVGHLSEFLKEVCHEDSENENSTKEGEILAPEYFYVKVRELNEEKWSLFSEPRWSSPKSFPPRKFIQCIHCVGA